MSNEYDFAWINENRLLDPRVEEDPFARAATRIRDAAVNQRIARPVRGEAVNKLTSALTSDINRFGNMLYSAATLPRDVITGRSQLPSETGVPGSVPFDSPEGQETFKRVQDLSGLAVGGSIPMVAAKGAARGPVLGTGVVPKEAPVKPVVQENAPIFYSGVEHALESTNLGTSTADQWLGTLKNAKGVKPEELQWLGVEEFLAEKKAKGEKVTRAELQDHIAQNKIEVKEVKKSGEIGARELSDEVNDFLADEFNKLNPNIIQQRGENFYLGELEAYVEKNWNRGVEAIDRQRSISGGGTKYSDYQLPGGRDYGELLLTLPSQKEPSGRYVVGLPNDKRMDRAFNTKSEAQEELNAIKAQYGDRGSQFIIRQEMRPVNEYTTSHWDEPNVLAHVRYNTRDIDGKKTLFVEEIQSDWHQQGKKQGYQEKRVEPRDTSKWTFEDLGDTWGGGRRGGPHMWRINDETGREIGASRAATGEEALAGFRRTEANRRDTKGVPDAPFKKSWPELSFKRMLRYAAENGYDAIAWTPGETQAARYDLSKHVDKLRYNPETQHLLGFKGENKSIDQLNVTPEKLPDYVGKDAAEKLLKVKRDVKLIGGNYGEISGLDLKVGGEGMMRFYDDQLPVIAGKYAKAHGGKVEQKGLSSTLEINEQPAKLNTKTTKIEKDRGTYRVIDETIDHGSFATEEGARNFIKHNSKSQFLVDDPNNPDAGVQIFSTREAAEDHVRQHSPNVHYMELPSSLRDTALRKGFPLFSHGVMLTPVDGNPFEQQKKDK